MQRASAALLALAGLLLLLGATVQPADARSLRDVTAIGVSGARSLISEATTSHSSRSRKLLGKNYSAFAHATDAQALDDDAGGSFGDDELSTHASADGGADSVSASADGVSASAATGGEGAEDDMNRRRRSLAGYSAFAHAKDAAAGGNDAGAGGFGDDAELSSHANVGNGRISVSADADGASANAGSGRMSGDLDSDDDAFGGGDRH